MSNTMFHKLRASIASIVAIATLAVAVPVKAETEPLRIIDVDVAIEYNAATITWTTNRRATGLFEYGTSKSNYTVQIETNRSKTTQQVSIARLQPEKTYYFRIEATDRISETSTFEQSFKTGKRKPEMPKITSRVKVIYITGTTATIQWATNEITSSEVEYGPTTSYGRRATGANGQVHEVVLRGLKKNTTYNFRAKSRDTNNNTIISGNFTFKTERSLTEEQGSLLITSITPVSKNDPTITGNSVIITWKTNKPTQGWVRYQKAAGGSVISVTEPAPRRFDHAITITNLQPNTTYNFEINARDIFNKTAKSRLLTFTTREESVGGITANSNGIVTNDDEEYTSAGQVLGAFSCNIDTAKDFGFFGMYYNLPDGHPDVNLRAGKNTKESKKPGSVDWYDEKYFSMNRIDPQLNFPSFFPLNEGLRGDPNLFAVAWRAMVFVPENGNYEYSVTSDDDSWVYIDEKLVTDLGGLHEAKTLKNSLTLTKGYHKVEIYYADRGKGKAVMIFKPDSRLQFHPLPEGCEINDVLNPKPQGQVLGTSNIDYTPAVALYRTKTSPDVYAIYANGTKHYISGPTAFGNYGYRASDVKTVSEETLAKYPDARLVKTPGDNAIYFLYQRQQKQWLKIAIPSPTVFASYPQNSWGNVAIIDAVDLDTYPYVQLIRLKGDTAVYFLEGTTKHRFTDAAAFERLGFNWAEVVEINQAHFDSYLNGPEMR